MKYSNFLNHEYAYFKMKKLFQDSSKDLGIPFSFGFTGDDAVGRTFLESNSLKPHHVYISYFETNNRGGFVDRLVDVIDIKAFLKVVYALKHEERHVQQYKAMNEAVCYEDLTDDKVSCMAKEVLAIATNDIYYHQKDRDFFYDNGAHMLTELDAQVYAIKSLYSYCEKEYGRDKAEDLVFDIITSELFVLSDHRKSGKDYIEIPRDKIKYDEEESKWVVKDFTCNDVLKLYEEEINRTLIENRRRYITRDSYYIPELHAYKGEDKKLLPVKDSVFEWLENNVDNTFDFSTFPDYFGTSGDVDKFVIIVTDCILKQRGNDRDLKSIVEKTDCIKNESFVWNEQVFIDMFQNEKPKHQFSFDKYKMKQDLERRLQTVQDNAEEKGLVSNEEINIERGGIE